MVGPGNYRQVIFRQIAVGTVDQVTQVAGIDEKGLAAAVAFWYIPASTHAARFVPIYKPQADRDLGGVE